MSVQTSLLALANTIDPSLSHWEAVLSTGKRLSEKSMLPSLKKGVVGWRAFDWTLDMVATGDIYRLRELWLICPSGQKACLEISDPGTAFQFKAKTLSIMAGGGQLEYQVIGRVVDKQAGLCECWIWDYHPAPEQPALLAYRSNVYAFGAWKESMMPIGALNIDVQGLRL